MSILPLEPATVGRIDTGPDRSARLTIWLADGTSTHITVEWWQTDADGLSRAVAAAVASRMMMDADKACALASWEADNREPLEP